MSDLLAKTSYDAYWISRGRVNRGNTPLVPWAEANPSIRQAHRACVNAILGRVSDVLGAMTLVEEEPDAQDEDC